MHFGDGYGADLRDHNVRDARVEKERRHASTCSSHSLQPTRGLRASGGSLYLSKVLVPSAFLTVFVAAASNPDAAKLGLALSSGAAAADAKRDREGECGWERRGDAERRAEQPQRSSPWSSRVSRSRSRSSHRRSPLLSRYSFSRPVVVCVSVVSEAVVPAPAVATVSVPSSPSVIAVIPSSSVIMISPPRVRD